MPDKRKKYGLSDEQWAEVRAKVEAGVSFSALEKEYGTRRATIRDRAVREEWVVGVAERTVQDAIGQTVQGQPSGAPSSATVQDGTGQVIGPKATGHAQQPKGQNTGEPLAKSVGRRTLAKVIDIASKRGVDALQASGALDDLAQGVADTLQLLGRLRRKIGELQESILDDAISGKVQPAAIPGTRDKGQLLKDLTHSYQALLSAVRDDFGRKPGEATNKDAAPSTLPTRIEFAVLRTGTDGATEIVDVFPKPGEPDPFGPE